MAANSDSKFGSSAHLQAFTRSLPFRVVPTNVPGAYAVPDLADGLNVSSAAPTTLLRHGIPFRRPDGQDRPAVLEAWERAFGSKRGAGKVITPVLQPQMGRTHHLRQPAVLQNNNFNNNQWAGAVVKGTWVSATGQWTVPTVSKPSEAQGTKISGWDSSSWVGIDGFNGAGYTGSNDVLQAGVQQVVSASGNASYVAWFEWFVPFTFSGTINNISAGKLVLPETSPFAPALASLPNGPTYIAWKGDGNDQLNVAVYFDVATGFVEKLTVDDSSDVAPALCTHQGKLFIAWKGSGNDNLNIAQVALDPNFRPTGLINKVTLGDTSPISPSIASSNDTLFLAWKGDTNDNIYIMSSDDGLTWGNRFASPEETPFTPALAALNGQVFIAWAGTDHDNHLNVAVVDNDPGQGIATGISGKVVLGDSSGSGPALAGVNGYLFLAWKGSGNDNLNVMVSLNNAAGFGGKFISTETSPFGPALASANGGLFIGWRGDGNDQLNFAPVSLTGFTEPAYAFQVNIANFPVSPGDVVTCAATYLNTTAGMLHFNNQTTGQRFAVTLAPPAGATFSGETVEWIMEAPGQGEPGTALPSFTNVNFTGAFGCNAADSVVANPNNGDTVNILNGATTLTSVSVADDAVTISFIG